MTGGLKEATLYQDHVLTNIWQKIIRIHLESVPVQNEGVWHQNI